MSELHVSSIENRDNLGVSPETVERLTALVARHTFTEAEQAVMVDALARIHATQTLDALSEVSRLVRRGVKSTGSTMALAVTDYRKSLLEAEAVAVGIDKTLAAKIIEAAFEKARRELEAEAEARPERVAMRDGLAQIQADPTLETVRSVVYWLVKTGRLAQEQIDRESIVKAQGTSLYPASSDEAGKAALAAVYRAISDGITVALDKPTDTPQTAKLRKDPFGALPVVSELARTESRFMDAATFERLMAVAILEGEGRVVAPTIEIDTAVEAEIEMLKVNPSLRQLLASTMKVARRGSDISIDVFERLAAPLLDKKPEAPLVPGDTVLTVPAEPQPEAPQGPTPMPETVTLRDPKTEAPDYLPPDGWAPSSKTERLLPDENGVIHAGSKPDMRRDFGDNAAGRFEQPARTAWSKAEKVQPKSPRVVAVDGQPIGHRSLAQRRGIVSE